ncbi:MAG: inositol monophosphatase family protein [Acidobacteriota bacterium]
MADGEDQETEPSAAASQELLDTAIRGARAGAEVLRHYFRGAENEVRHKGAHDRVSQADHDSEAAIIAEVCRQFPTHCILAEESGKATRAGDEDPYEWVIDPLDGTSNFLQGLPVFSVSVACRYRGEVVVGVVLDPVGDQLFSARRGHGAFRNGQPIEISQRGGLDKGFLATGYPFRARGALDRYLEVFRDVFLRASSIRRCGSAALDLAYTAAGVYDGFFEFRLSPWDFAAGVLLVREAGGVVTDLDGGDGFFTSGNLVAGPRALHGELLATIRQHVDEQHMDEIDPRVPVA